MAPVSAPGQNFWVFLIFIFSFRTIPINIPNFTLLRYREVLFTQSRVPGSAPGQNFFSFQNFPFSFWVIGISIWNFTLLRYRESALHHISPGVWGPWIRPWRELLGFRILIFSFRTIHYQ